MKKLMVMIGAAAAAFGLYAANNGTGFDSMSAGATTAEALTTADGLATWTLAEGTTATVTAWGSETGASSRPAQWKSEEVVNYLAVQSSLTDGAARTIAQGGLGFGTEAGEGLYVDTLVKFTAADEAVEVTDENAKIAVWAKEVLDANDNVTGTNLIVTAGHYTGSEIDNEAVDYNLGTFAKVGQWVRLTIKAVDGGAAKGFVVYVDGDAKVCEDAKTAFGSLTLSPSANEFRKAGKLFPSMQSFNSLEAIAIAGQGAIDDISFTQTTPDFAKDFEFYTIAAADNSNIDGFMINDVAYTASQTAQFVFAEATSVTVSNITYSAQYFGDKSTTVEVTEARAYTFGESMAKEKKVQIGTGDNAKYYASLQDAINAISTSAASGDLVLQSAINLGTQGVMAACDLVIDLNGQAITYTGSGAVITMTAGNLTIKNSDDAMTASLFNGVIDAGTDENAVAIDQQAGKLKVLGGRIAGAISIDARAEPPATCELIDGQFNDENAKAFKAEGKKVVDVGETGYWTLDNLATVALTIVNETGATITGVEAGNVVEGSNITFTVTAADGYKNAAATVMGATATGSNPYTFTVGTEAITITVTATQMETYTVTAAAELNEHVTAVTADPASFREDAESKVTTLSATFESGYELDYFTVDGVQIAGNTYTVSKSITVNAVAKQTLTPSQKFIADIGNAKPGDTVTATADITLTDTLVIDKAITVDLGGHTVALANIDADGVRITAEATLQNGTLNSTRTAYPADALSAPWAVLTTKSAAFTNLTVNAAFYRKGLGHSEEDVQTIAELYASAPTKTVNCKNVTVTGGGTLFYAEYATMNLDSCTATKSGDSFSYAAAIYSSCNAQINVISGTNTHDYALISGNLGGRITVTDGSFSGKIKSYMEAGLAGRSELEKLDAYKAKFALNGGTYSNCSIEFTDASKASRAIDSFTKAAEVAITAPTGYGWKNDTTLTKTWTVTYKVEDVADTNETVYDGDKPASVPTPAEKTGYTGAWDVDPTAATITADTTFTYSYTLKTYTVTYTTNTVDYASEVVNHNGSPAKIPELTGGAWDVDPNGAIITCATNFNYTIQTQKQVEPGQALPISADTPEEAAKEAAKYTPVPADKAAADAGQASVLKSVAVWDAGQSSYVVTAAIDESKIVSPEQTVAKAADSLATIAAAADNAEVAVSLADKVTPGLYYSLAVQTDLASDEWTEGTRVLATEANKASIAPTVTKPAGGKAFFKVMVNMMPTPAN